MRQEARGALVVEHRTFDPLSGMHGSRVRVFQDGERRENEAAIRRYLASKFRRAVSETGLQLSATYGDGEGGKFTRGSRGMLVAARRA